ncbi:MAG: serine protease [Verrucomicrobiales bacterium]|nr:serine protease [Verrucomicrobiales bacterium]
MQSKSGAFGSGVMISKEGYLLTAAHVVGAVGEIVTLFRVGADPVAASVERILYDQDVALVRVVEEESGVPFPFVEIDGGSIDLDSIVEVVAFGHASGFREKRPAPPRLGYLTRNGGPDTLISTVRLTAGDSGGPLFDLQGCLIGLHITVDPKSGQSTHVAISGLRELWGDVFDPAS